MYFVMVINDAKLAIALLGNKELSELKKLVRINSPAKSCSARGWKLDLNLYSAKLHEQKLFSSNPLSVSLQFGFPSNFEQ